MADPKFTKPTADDLWNTEFFQLHAYKAVNAACDELTERMIDAFRRFVPECESPLETAFVAWWLAFENAHLINDIGIQPQRKVVAGGKNYRVDLVIAPYSYGLFRALERDAPKIAVELDGHDFHERTKEQVTHRNKRDRDLVADGWKVLHFSGSEFNAKPLECVMGVYGAATQAFSKEMFARGYWSHSQPAQPAEQEPF